MRRRFLSYRLPEHALAERLKTAIERKDPGSRVFFAPTKLRAGGSWSAQLAQEIAEANAFILLVGEQGRSSTISRQVKSTGRLWSGPRGSVLEPRRRPSVELAYATRTVRRRDGRLIGKWAYFAGCAAV